MLNTYKMRSFYNMKGFGDISILALLKTNKEATKGALPSMTFGDVIITTDGPLIMKIKKEFNNPDDEFDLKIKTCSGEEFFS